MLKTLKDVDFVYLSNVCVFMCFIGGASEEEEEVGGGSGVGSAVGSVGSGYGSRYRPHLQHGEGRSPLYSGTTRLKIRCFSY